MSSRDETRGGGRNLFRSRSRLGLSRLWAPLLLMLTHHTLLLQGARHKSQQVDSLITRPLLLLTPLHCDNGFLQRRRWGASGPGRRPAFHRSRVRGFGNLHGRLQALTIDGSRDAGRNQTLPGVRACV